MHLSKILHPHSGPKPPVEISIDNLQKVIDTLGTDLVVLCLGHRGNADLINDWCTGVSAPSPGMALQLTYTLATCQALKDCKKRITNEEIQEWFVGENAPCGTPPYGIISDGCPEKMKGLVRAAKCICQ